MKEVAILGCGPTHVECKYDIETWGVNGTYTFAKKLDKLFMTDDEPEVNACWYDYNKLKEHKETTLVFPIRYKRFEDIGLPIEIYPIEEVLAKFKTRFFSNSIAYMIAYALLKDYTKIWFYGIDMMTNSTYIQEKGGVEYWMGIAKGMSIERESRGLEPIQIINMRGSATGKTFNGKMYGYYGTWESERAKEKLYAPFELVRTSRASNPQNEWIKQGDEYIKHKTHTKAGEEVVQ